MSSSTADMDSGGIMSSIKAVREILMMDRSTQNPSSLEDELSVIKQARYEDGLRFEEQLENQKDLVQALQSQLEQVRQESNREKGLRQTLEKTNEALDEHKKALSMQLETVSQSRGSLEGTTAAGVHSNLTSAFEKEKEAWKANTDRTNREKDQFLKKSSKWEARCLALQRQNDELNTELVAIQQQLKDENAQHEEVVQSHFNVHEELKSSFEAIKASSSNKDGPDLTAKSSDGTQGTLSSSIGHNIQELEAQKLILETQINETASKHQETVASNQHLTQQLEEIKAARKKTHDKLEQVQKELEAVRRHVSQDEIKKERKVQAQMATKMSSLTSSFGKMSEKLESLRADIATIEMGSSPSKFSSQQVAKKKEQMALETVKVGAIFETMESQLKEKLKMTHAKVAQMSLELASVREVWRQAKEDETAAQAELDDCRSRIGELAKTLDTPSSPTNPNKRSSDKKWTVASRGGKSRNTGF